MHPSSNRSSSSARRPWSCRGLSSCTSIAGGLPRSTAAGAFEGMQRPLRCPASPRRPKCSRAAGGFRAARASSGRRRGPRRPGADERIQHRRGPRCPAPWRPCSMSPELAGDDGKGSMGRQGPLRCGRARCPERLAEGQHRVEGHGLSCQTHSESLGNKWFQWGAPCSMSCIGTSPGATMSRASLETMYAPTNGNPCKQA